MVLCPSEKNQNEISCREGQVNLMGMASRLNEQHLRKKINFTFLGLFGIATCKQNIAKKYGRYGLVNLLADR